MSLRYARLGEPTTPALLLSLSDVHQMWDAQCGRCNICKLQMEWSPILGGRTNCPGIDRVDVLDGTYVGNFQWLCKYCNSVKGFRVEMMRFEESNLAAVDKAIADLSSSPSVVKEMLEEEVR